MLFKLIDYNRMNKETIQWKVFSANLRALQIPTFSILHKLANYIDKKEFKTPNQYHTQRFLETAGYFIGTNCINVFILSVISYYALSTRYQNNLHTTFKSPVAIAFSIAAISSLIFTSTVFIGCYLARKNMEAQYKTPPLEGATKDLMFTNPITLMSSVCVLGLYRYQNKSDYKKVNPLK